jgi:hypothetical protein
MTSPKSQNGSAATDATSSSETDEALYTADLEFSEQCSAESRAHDIQNCLGAPDRDQFGSCLNIPHDLTEG